MLRWESLHGAFNEGHSQEACRHDFFLGAGIRRNAGTETALDPLRQETKGV